MQRIEVEALSTTPNAAVLKIPGRAFPGILIQGDSLHILQGLIHRVHAHLVSHDTTNTDLNEDTPLEIVEEIKDLLDGYVTAYETTMGDCNYVLPYHKI
jgi:hypothetical protein